MRYVEIADAQRLHAEGTSASWEIRVPILPTAPRSLKAKENVLARHKLLNLPHIAPLVHYVRRLEERHPAVEFPSFDPLDAGIQAEILFLFEKPGRKTSLKGGGSGFISRDNDDQTAAATFNFMEVAKLARHHTAIWNIIPGWNGTRAVTTRERVQGIEELERLLPLMARLRTIVLVGGEAQRARLLVGQLGLNVLESAHPSPIVRASRPEVWRSIPIRWSRAAQV